MKRKKRSPVIIIAGSSSGGHVTPINPIASEIKKKLAGARLVYVGQKGDVFADLINKKNVPSKKLIYSGKFRWYHNQGLSQLLDVRTTLLNIRDVFLVVVGIIEAYFLLARIKPTVVFIKGGSVAMPLGIIAALKKIPIVTHDSDNRPGRGSKFLRKWVVVHTVGMDSKDYGFDEEDTLYVGIPIDDYFYKPLKQNDIDRVVSKYKLTDKKSILVIGGSQGAHKLNAIIHSALDELLNVASIIHVVGKADIDRHEGREGYFAVEFIDHKDVPAYFHSVDLIISRAGATYLAEVAAVGKPVIIIPGKQLSGGHQQANSKYYTLKGAGIGLDEDELLEDNRKFIEGVKLLLNDSETVGVMVKAQEKLRVRDSAKQIAKVIIDTASRHEKTKK